MNSDRLTRNAPVREGDRKSPNSRLSERKMIQKMSCERVGDVDFLRELHERITLLTLAEADFVLVVREAYRH